jgi:hypothetical protein
MLWDGVVAAHQSTDMNGQRFLFRLWLHRMWLRDVRMGILFVANL